LRKHLIRQLVFGGRQLACLITGRRGMGKTSFVRYCLQEYEHNAFERFRRIPTGKSLPDYLVVGVFIALAAFAAVIGAEFTGYAISAGNRGGTKMLGALIGVACLVPLIFFVKYAWIVDSYIIIGKGRYGCNNRKRGTGMCTTSITITQQRIEERILACLRHSLMAPERVQTDLRPKFPPVIGRVRSGFDARVGR
jgi:hypothetical protein